MKKACYQRVNGDKVVLSHNMSNIRAALLKWCLNFNYENVHEFTKPVKVCQLLKITHIEKLA